MLVTIQHLRLTGESYFDCSCWRSVGRAGVPAALGVCGAGKELTAATWCFGKSLKAGAMYPGPSPYWSGKSAVLHAISTDHQHVAQELSESSGSAGAAHEFLHKQQQQDMQHYAAFAGSLWYSKEPSKQCSSNRRSNHNHVSILHDEESGLELQ